MLSKAKMREWPWNNMPSKRHEWFVVGQNVDGCKRCGTRFHRIADTRGAVYCYATADWLREHPDDDGKQG
jgi:hypothetical protein